MATYTTVAPGVRMSEEIVNQAIRGTLGFGVMGDGLNLQRAVSLLTRLTTPRVELDGNTYTQEDITYQGTPVRVFYVGSSPPSLAFPFAGTLVGTLADQEARLIRMLEEAGCARYRLVKR